MVKLTKKIKGELNSRYFLVKKIKLNRKIRRKKPIILMKEEMMKLMETTIISTKIQTIQMMKRIKM